MKSKFKSEKGKKKNKHKSNVILKENSVLSAFN